MVLSFPFWNDLKNSEICQWPGIVRKHQLTPQDIERVSKIVKAGNLEEEWFNLLYLECRGCGLLKADKVFDKYELKGRLLLKEKLMKRFLEGGN